MQKNKFPSYQQYWLFAIGFVVFYALTPVAIQAQNSNLKIECIMIGQTDVFDIGRACEVSMDRCEDWIQDIESATGIPASITRIEGADYNKTNIDNFLSTYRLDDPENTIVIFYGTGHGFNYQSNTLKYPVFGVHPTRKQFTGAEFNTVALSLQKDIHEPLLAMGPKFLLTIGELCNEIVDNLEIPEKYVPELLPMSPCNANYDELFTQTSGDIIAASSKREQLSFTSGLTGGVFFGAFLEAFEEVAHDCARTPNWGTIFNKAQEDTEAINGQIPIYDAGYIDSAVELVNDWDPPRQKARKKEKANQDRLRFKRKDKFEGDEIIAPTIIYIEN